MQFNNSSKAFLMLCLLISFNLIISMNGVNSKVPGRQWIKKCFGGGEEG